MRIRIHRGTKEIGGTCIEMEAQGKRIALDVGLPLDAPDDPEEHKSLLPEVAGFREPDDSLLGVLISHPTGTTTASPQTSGQRCRST